MCVCALRLTLVKMKICLCLIHTLCANVLYALWPSLAVWYNIHFDGLFTITMWRFDQPIFDVNTRLFCGTKTYMWLNVRNVCSANLVCYECIDGDWTLRTIDCESNLSSIQISVFAYSWNNPWYWLLRFKIVYVGFGFMKWLHFLSAK